VVYEPSLVLQIQPDHRQDTQNRHDGDARDLERFHAAYVAVPTSFIL
jgi:hypothetical protein